MTIKAILSNEGKNTVSTERSESIKELAIALAKAQAAIAPALKSAENPHFRSRYADLPAVWEACRKPLTDNGLSIVQMPVDAGEVGRVALMTMLLHTSGEFISSTVSTRLQKDDAQGIGSALTYLRRYSLAAMVGVVADEDDDGNAASRPAAGGTTYRPRTTEHTNGSTPGKASEKQIKKLFAMWKEGNYEGTLQDWVKATFNCKIEELTVKQASEAIETLQPAEQPA